ncbi:MAG TPA: hypothetical protein VJH88_00960 [Candidatus Nanoarchaeia archaeon]|nr:hypothetical protein [Candidatus Nanoarchaeia archaeon]
MANKRILKKWERYGNPRERAQQRTDSAQQVTELSVEQAAYNSPEPTEPATYSTEPTGAYSTQLHESRATCGSQSSLETEASSEPQRAASPRIRNQWQTLFENDRPSTPYIPLAPQRIESSASAAMATGEVAPPNGYGKR